MVFVGDREPSGLTANWKWLVGIGAVVAVLGLIALWNVIDATVVTTVLVGWVLAFAGVMHVATAFAGGASGGSRILQAILGVAYFLIGLDLVFNPLTGAITLTVALALMLIVVGIARVVTAFMVATDRWLAIVLGIIDILLGIWLWTGIPYSAVALGFFVGIELLMTGITWIMAGFAVRSATDQTAGAAP
jgi:uncharacterized membrane protein HdeD (DUF308 family)